MKSFLTNKKNVEGKNSPINTESLCFVTRKFSETSNTTTVMQCIPIAAPSMDSVQEYAHNPSFLAVPIVYVAKPWQSDPY